MAKTISYQIAIPNLVLPSDIFETAYRIGMRQMCVLPWAYTPKQYKKRMDEIVYEVSEDSFYWP